MKFGSDLYIAHTYIIFVCNHCPLQGYHSSDTEIPSMEQKKKKRISDKP